MRETYKAIPGYTRYSVSDAGIVKSLNKVLKPYIDKDGYLKVRLYNKGYKNVFIHRLVAGLFCDNPNGLPCVNHKNEIKCDNRSINLEWCTVKYNNRYSQKQYKLSDEKACEIRLEYSTGKTSHYKIAKKYGVSANAIMQVLKNKSYATN